MFMSQLKVTLRVLFLCKKDLFPHTNKKTVSHNNTESWHLTLRDMVWMNNESNGQKCTSFGIATRLLAHANMRVLGL